MSDTALKPYGYAPGSYQCLCHGCGEQHVADKGAWRCLKCAVSARGKVPLVSDWRDEGPVSDAARDVAATPTTDRHTDVPSMKERLEKAASEALWITVCACSVEDAGVLVGAIVREQITICQQQQTHLYEWQREKMAALEAIEVWLESILTRNEG